MGIETELYKENSERAYPFINNSVVLTGGIPVPNSFIVDAGITLGVGVPYFGAPGAVRLFSIARPYTNILEITFSIATGITHQYITFSRNVLMSFGATSYSATELPAIATGFMVTGTMSTEFVSYIPEGTTLYVVSGSAYLEQECIVSAYRHGVATINVGNLPRTTVGQTSAADRIRPVSTGLIGRVILAGGHNMRVTGNGTNRSITLSPANGAGLGVLCEEIENYSGERSGNELLTGGQKCKNLVYSINGVSPDESGNFRITGSAGVNVSTVGGCVVISGEALEDIAYCVPGEEDDT